jgi:hypothetical protein
MFTTIKDPTRALIIIEGMTINLANVSAISETCDSAPSKGVIYTSGGSEILVSSDDAKKINKIIREKQV